MWARIWVRTFGFGWLELIDVHSTLETAPSQADYWFSPRHSTEPTGAESAYSVPVYEFERVMVHDKCQEL